MSWALEHWYRHDAEQTSLPRDEAELMEGLEYPGGPPATSGDFGLPRTPRTPKGTPGRGHISPGTPETWGGQFCLPLLGSNSPRPETQGTDCARPAGISDADFLRYQVLAGSNRPNAEYGDEDLPGTPRSEDLDAAADNVDVFPILSFGRTPVEHETKAAVADLQPPEDWHHVRRKNARRDVARRLNCSEGGLCLRQSLLGWDRRTGTWWRGGAVTGS